MCSGFSPFAIDAYLPGLPAIADELGTSASLAQFTLTGFLITLGLSQVIIGPLSDQWGRRKLLLIGLAGTTVASALCAIAPNIWFLIIARMIQGAFGGAGVVLARAIVADLGHGIGVAKAYALLMSFQSIAPVIAPIAGGFIVPTLGWRAVFWFLVLIGIATFTLNYLLIPESLPDNERNPAGVRQAARSMGSLLRTRHFLAPVAIFILSFAILFAYISASPFVLQRIAGLSETQFSIAFSTNSIMLLVTSLISAKIVGRVGVVNLITYASFAGALATAWLTVAVFAFDTAGWAIIIGFFILVSACGFLIPNAGALTAHASGNKRGSGSAVMGAGQYGLAAIIAPLTGIGDGQSAVPMVIVMIVAGCLQMFVLLHVRAEHGSDQGHDENH